MSDEIDKIEQCGRTLGKQIAQGWKWCTAILGVALLVSLGGNIWQMTRTTNVTVSQMNDYSNYNNNAIIE